MNRVRRNVLRESFWSSAPPQASEDPIGYIASILVKDDYDPDELFGNKGFKVAAKAIKKQGYAPLEVEEELASEGVDDDVASEIAAEIFDEGGPNPIDFRIESRNVDRNMKITSRQLKSLIKEEINRKKNLRESRTGDFYIIAQEIVEAVCDVQGNPVSDDDDIEKEVDAVIQVMTMYKCYPQR